VARNGGGAVAARVAGIDPRNHARLRANFAVRSRAAAGRKVVAIRAEVIPHSCGETFGQ
jgi:hypothetical protein